MKRTSVERERRERENRRKGDEGRGLYVLGSVRITKRAEMGLRPDQDGVVQSVRVLAPSSPASPASAVQRSQ